MDVAVAISAERDQIFVCVVTQQASRANVMNLETPLTLTSLDFAANFVGWKIRCVQGREERTMPEPEV